ncbi:MAG: hypothetical protein CM15mP33_03200 [Candidatus Neomarinimicrobiota bacterium]|nr:MAG: hypothetical protein CM15mP33_03200 [Candidatus Neomarinimicrobiota bacterium]
MGGGGRRKQKILVSTCFSQRGKPNIEGVLNKDVKDFLISRWQRFEEILNKKRSKENAEF